MPRILVIDDDPAVLKATKIMLEARGFEVVAVGSGRLGVERVKAEAFDAVIVDLFMPGMDGLETTRAIHECNAALPIIAVSGFMFRGRGRCPAMPNFHPIAAEAGAVAAVYKPLRPNELHQIITDAIRARRLASAS
jgi:CheY-like chemotaxis protein